jgi:hypothetical protein
MCLEEYYIAKTALRTHDYSASGLLTISTEKRPPIYILGSGL